LRSDQADRAEAAVERFDPLQRRIEECLGTHFAGDHEGADAGCVLGEQGLGGPIERVYRGSPVNRLRQPAR
jgi:hypothetical protein